MDCPNCHTNQPESRQCISCGLVFEKHNPVGPSKRKAPSVRTDHIKKNKPNAAFRIWIVALAITAISAGSIVYFYTTRPRTSEAPVPPTITEETKGNLFQSAVDAMVIVRSPWAEGFGFFINDRGHVLTLKRIVSYEKTDTDPVWNKIRKLNADLERKEKRLDALETDLDFRGIPDRSFWKKTERIDALSDEVDDYQRQIDHYESGTTIYMADGSERNAVLLKADPISNVALLSVGVANASYIRSLKTWPTGDYLSGLLTDADKAYVVCSLKGLSELKTVRAIFTHNTTYGANHYSVTTKENVNINAVGSPLLNKEGQLLGICDFEFFQGKCWPAVPVLETFGSAIGY